MARVDNVFDVDIDDPAFVAHVDRQQEHCYGLTFSIHPPAQASLSEIEVFVRAALNHNPPFNGGIVTQVLTNHGDGSFTFQLQVDPRVQYLLDYHALAVMAHKGMISLPPQIC
jgi:hypothetical protein